MRKSLLAIVIVGSFSGIATAQDAYWVDSSGQMVRNSSGECWRTISWTEAQAIPECEGGKYAKPAPKAAEAPKPVVVEAPPPVVVAPVVAPEPIVEKQAVSLNAKTMFATGKSELTDTSSLDELIVDMKKKNVSDLKEVNIEGYTDQTGKPATNNRLSQQRADSVKAYLVNNGIDADKITATGKGSANPVVEMSECKGKKGGALSACLAPNRRIEVSIDGIMTVIK